MFETSHISLDVKLLLLSIVLVCSLQMSLGKGRFRSTTVTKNPSSNDAIKKSHKLSMEIASMWVTALPDLLSRSL